MRSFCELTETHSPAAIEMPPATAPAKPASRTTELAAPDPANPKISDTLDTRPSLAPNTAARANPPDTGRWPVCGSAEEAFISSRVASVFTVGRGGCRGGVAMRYQHRADVSRIGRAHHRHIETVEIQ